MKRKALTQIQSWYEKESSLPLIIKGPKGVGKTRLVFDFLGEYDGNKVYLNLEQNPGLSQLFQSNDEEYIVRELQEYFSLEPTKETILILDECRQQKEILFSILTEYASYARYKFIIITSTEIQDILANQSRFPDGNCFEELYIMPLDFEEFLAASNNNWYISVIREHFSSCKPLPDIVHQELLYLFYQYMLTGGMPGAINEYLLLESTLNVSEQHQLILDHQIANLKEVYKESLYYKMLQIIDSIDAQLAKKNKKFQYSRIRKGVTASQYSEALRCLKKNRFILSSSPITGEQGSEKLYLYDVGVLVSKAKKNSSSDKLEIHSDLYKGFLENYVAQSLFQNGYELFYWDSKSQAKLDFVLHRGHYYTPIEVFVDDYTKSRSVHGFKEYYQVDTAYKVSAQNFMKKGDVQYVPYYSVFCI